MFKKVFSKNENKILLMLAFFSISIGLWNNFRQLWLEDNSYSVSSISNIISFGTLISVIAIAFIGKYVKLNKLKNTLLIVLILKFVNMLILYIFNQSNLISTINILIIIDIVTEYITITSIYPLITILKKNGALYSKRRLTEYLFRDIGILFGGIFIGKSISNFLIDYNTCLIVSNIFLLISIFIMMTIKLETNNEVIKGKSSCLKIVLKSKIMYLYLIYTLLGTIAMSTALGLKMLTLTNYFNYSDNLATVYLLVIGLLADIFGIIALKYLTPKNDYITITIKFGIRFIWYILAYLSNNLIITLLAISWSIFISTSYENICDAVYINRLENKYQLSFSNMCHIIRFLGESVGVFLCGIMYEMGLRYMFGLSAFFMIFQISLAYYLISLRKRESIINE
jgi:predicted MFS family arabinose efflux permease